MEAHVAEIVSFNLTRLNVYSQAKLKLSYKLFRVKC